MSLPSPSQSQLEDLYNDAVDTIYTYVDDNIEDFIDEAVAHAMFTHQTYDGDLLREDELEIDVRCAITDYLNRRKN
tara:strand:+ start:23 stop:250 length:228 start_codon:yes stop_codon:yes gene_type:complete